MDKLLPGILDDAVHDRLWLGRDEFCNDAGIPVEHLHTSMVGVCSEAELAYFLRGSKTLITEDHCWGLYYTGTGYKPPVALRMSYLAGGYLRNFIRARVIVLNDLMAQIEANNPPDISVVLIPDFYTGKTDKKAMPAWKVRQLYSWLLQRWQRSQHTIIAVSNLKDLSSEWGPHVGEHISEFFAEVTP
jgi:hypothetical protein